MMGFGYEMGLSAQAISGKGSHHPWDPSDLLRCVNYCDMNSIDTQRLMERMAGRSAEWDRLLPEWDGLVELLRHEMNTRTDYQAPLTYNEMKRVLAGGIPCSPCDSSGRGEECARCKGTGRRSGGKCRAHRCFRGADSCCSCGGNGYTTDKEVA